MGVSISEFRGEYYFLSNFYSAPVTYNGMCFENNEAAFQAAKCPERMTEFCRLNPSEAKRLGRRVKLRGDWEAVKDKIFSFHKFSFRSFSNLFIRCAINKFFP